MIESWQNNNNYNYKKWLIKAIKVLMKKIKYKILQIKSYNKVYLISSYLIIMVIYS